jgi:nucleoid-associated protein YgaU
MKRLIIFILIAGLMAGCATTKQVKNPTPEEIRKETLDTGLDNLKKGIEARKKGNDAKAVEAFDEACRRLREIDNENRTIISATSEQLKKVVEISGFEYAPKESFNLLITYLDMMNAVMNSDAETVKTLSAKFNADYPLAQQRTAENKQKHLEELGNEVVQQRETIQKQAETTLLENYPTIYVVKKGDTLPSIAARHEIYNDSFMWPLIYKANRDQIKDPRVLYTGQDLKIPREINTDEIIVARREAGAQDPEKIPKDAFLPRGKKK